MYIPFIYLDKRSALKVLCCLNHRFAFLSSLCFRVVTFNYHIIKKCFQPKTNNQIHKKYEILNKIYFKVQNYFYYILNT